jgi:copper chaperone
MTLQLKVPDMACSACEENIAKAVKIVDPAATVRADSKTKLVNIETGASQAAITEAITNAGYTIAN